ncbi:MAG TPA: 6-carboxytetrahydropterin synthase QueD [Burkholderiales bacterium]|jgi:6-pyruvoyltetrahydropterin/6-carboxytetrahydropterin synthase|nr:6-carboxytetrahydropterin synthase QueD [Burkholderiales bacterium]
MRITRRLEFDAGHRIPHHESQCRHLHGHRYAIEVTVSGDVIVDDRDPEQGMVADFGGIKALIQHHIVAPWDHAFLAYARDRAVLDFLATLPGHRTVTFEAPPTAEHLAATALRILAPAFAAAYGERLHVDQVRIYETPNCWADALPAER